MQKVVAGLRFRHGPPWRSYRRARGFSALSRALSSRIWPRRMTLGRPGQQNLPVSSRWPMALFELRSESSLEAVVFSTRTARCSELPSCFQIQRSPFSGGDALDQKRALAFRGDGRGYTRSPANNAQARARGAGVARLGPRRGEGVLPLQLKRRLQWFRAEEGEAAHLSQPGAPRPKRPDTRVPSARKG